MPMRVDLHNWERIHGPCGHHFSRTKRHNDRPSPPSHPSGSNTPSWHTALTPTCMGRPAARPDQMRPEPLHHLIDGLFPPGRVDIVYAAQREGQTDVA